MKRERENSTFFYGGAFFCQNLLKLLLDRSNYFINEAL
nr:MAG TPA: hypothetical protein [Bacteriophage sp.]